MLIGILQTGHAPDELQPEFGDYDSLFRRLLGKETFDYVTYPVVDDLFPDDVTSADGWLITGSRYSVNDDAPWISKLIDLIRLIKASDRPMVGICFGHQAIAKALGGAVGRNPGGWIAGTVRYEHNNSSHDQALFAWHREQVVELPGEAEIIASSEDCPYAVLRYGKAALTYQAHPEFTAGFVKGLVRTRGQNLSDAIKNRANAADDSEVARVRIAGEISNFLKSR